MLFFYFLHYSREILERTNKIQIDGKATKYGGMRLTTSNVSSANRRIAERIVKGGSFAAVSQAITMSLFLRGEGIQRFIDPPRNRKTAGARFRYYDYTLHPHSGYSRSINLVFRIRKIEYVDALPMKSVETWSMKHINKRLCSQWGLITK